jgi:hypothetical protein
LRHAWALALLALAAGCATEVPLGTPAIDESSVRGQAEALRAQPTTRQAVRDALGAPLLTAPDGSADVFHVTAKQHQLALVMMFPMPAFGLRHEAYTLVVYGPQGEVTSVDSAYRRHEAGDLEQGVLLQAGDHEFLRAQADWLLVRPQRYLAARPGGETRCTLLVGCVAGDCEMDPYDPWGCGVCWNRLQVDDGPVRELPLAQLAIWRLDDGKEEGRARCEELGGEFSTGSGPMCMLRRYALAPLQLAPGRHRLVASAKSLDGEASGEFECGAGEVVHAALYGEIAERYSLSRQLGAGLRTGAATGRITFSAEPPAGLQGQSVILNW